MGARTRAMIWGLIALVVGGLAYLLGVGSLLGQRAEASVLDASTFTADPPAPLSLVSIPAVGVAMLCVALLALWVHGISRSLMILGAGAAAILASQLLKESWLERPQLFELDAWNTFPSGHMTVFAVLVAGFIWALPAGSRGFATLIGAVLLGTVSWQLLEFGWHRPSDLLGAQALAVLLFALAAWIGPRRSRRDRMPTSAPRRSATYLLGVLGRLTMLVLAITGVVLVVGGLVLVAIAASTRSDELMLNAVEIAVVGVSALSALILAKLAP